MRLIDADALTEKCGDWYVEEGTAEGFIGTLGQLLSGQSEMSCSDIPNSSDTISRQQAIDEAEKWFFNLKDKRRVSEVLKDLPSVQPERKDALEKAVAVEAISDVLMSRFDISATYAYDVAESAVNRIEVMAKEMGKR